MIDEELQYIELCSEYNKLTKSNSEESKQLDIDEKQQGAIFKPKRKKRKRLVWIPLILKNNLKVETEPVFIFNLQKMMRRYDNEDIEKYKNYGIQDAGLGYFDTVKLDKIYQSIDVSFSTYFFGESDMNYLIQLYKSYQNQQYYNLALVLQEYQQYVNQVQSFISTFCNLNSNYTHEESVQFEKAVKQWANINLENDLFEILIGTFDKKQAAPKLNKLIFSKNLILFIGGEIQETYNELSLKRNLDYLTNFLKRRQKVDSEFEIEYTIKVLKNIINRIHEINIEDQITTLDGYTIPTTRICQTLFYDTLTGNLNKEVSPYFISVTKYSFEPQWIKFLIDQRSQRKITSQQDQFQKQYVVSQTAIQNFEEICQKEYFLEKFNYSQPNKPIQI